MTKTVMEMGKRVYLCLKKLGDMTRAGSGNAWKHRNYDSDEGRCGTLRFVAIGPKHHLYRTKHTYNNG